MKFKYINYVHIFFMMHSTSVLTDGSSSTTDERSCMVRTKQAFLLWMSVVILYHQEYGRSCHMPYILLLGGIVFVSVYPYLCMFVCRRKHCVM